MSEALSSEGKIRRALAALQFRKLQEVMCILNISLNSQNLFLVENSVADPYLDPHGSAFKKSARIRIRMRIRIKEVKKPRKSTSYEVNTELEDQK